MDGARQNDGQTQQSGKAFDPRPYLRRIRVRGQEAEYLDVKWRLAWLRTEHPNARITTEHVVLTDTKAVFRATVEVPGLGSATGHGSETSGDFPEFIEKAETKAIGRALAALGYGTQFALDFDLEEEAERGPGALADTPVERPPTIREVPRPRPARAPEPAAQPEPDTAAPVAEAPPAPTPRATRPAPAAHEPRPHAEEFSRADYSWNDFWHWARGLGYSSKSEVERLLEVDDLLKGTPREARQMLEEYRRAHGDENE